MHGHRPRDWDRFEREMRVWGRRLERDMRAWGDEFGRDFESAAEGMDGRARATGAGDKAWAGVWAWDCSPRAQWRARRMAERMARRRARAAAHDAARHAAGAAREGRRAMRCGGRMWFWSWWWLAIPLFFMSRNALEDIGGWAGLGAGVSDFATGSLGFTPAAPLARLLSQAVGVTFLEGFALLALAGAITAGAAWLGWRAGRPPGTRETL
jgi:hypothetical protein